MTIEEHVARAICFADEFECIHRDGKKGGFPIRAGECGTCYNIALAALAASKEFEQQIKSDADTA